MNARQQAVEAMAKSVPYFAACLTTFDTCGCLEAGACDCRNTAETHLDALLAVLPALGLAAVWWFIGD